MFRVLQRLLCGLRPQPPSIQNKNNYSFWFYLHHVPHLTWRGHGWISRIKGVKRVVLGVLSGVPQISWKCWCLTAEICTDDLAIYSQRKSSSTLPLLSTPALTPVKALSRNYPDYSFWSLAVKSPGAKCKYRAGSNCGAQLCLNSHGVLLAFRVRTAAAKVGHQQ